MQKASCQQPFKKRTTNKRICLRIDLDPSQETYRQRAWGMLLLEKQHSDNNNELPVPAVISDKNP